MKKSCKVKLINWKVTSRHYCGITKINVTNWASIKIWIKTTSNRTITMPNKSWKKMNSSSNFYRKSMIFRTNTTLKLRNVMNTNQYLKIWSRHYKPTITKDANVWWKQYLLFKKLSNIKCQLYRHKKPKNKSKELEERKRITRTGWKKASD